MTKDRLNDLKLLAEKERNEDTYVIIDSPRATGHDPITKFYDWVEEINGKLNELSHTAKTIRVKQSFLVSIPQADSRLQEEINGLMKEVKCQASAINDDLKFLEADNARLQDEETDKHRDGKASAMLRIRKAQHSCITQTFVGIMEEHNLAQVAFLESTKKKISRQIELQGRCSREEEVHSILDTGNLEAQVHQDIQIEDLDEAKHTLSKLESRDADIQKLEQSVHGLQEMFLDVAMLVKQQGAMIDRIETHVHESRLSMEHANAQLRLAGNYVDKYRRKKMLLWSVCVVLVCIAVVVVFLVVFV